MRFMLILRGNEWSEATLSPSPELLAALGALVDELKAAGVLLATGGLTPSADGARLRLARGRITLTDGPFMETKEVLGGFAIVRVASRAEAIELGKRFLQVHLDILGPSFELETEIRQMFDGGECGGADVPEHAETDSRA